MGGKLSKEEMAILKRNSNFTDAEIKQWHKGFMKDCPNGKLNKDQFKKIFNELFANTWFKKCPNGNADGFCKHTFRAFDRDKNGLVDFKVKEFLTAIDVTCNGSVKSKLEWAFRMYDINANGTIESTEMQQIIEAVYEMMGGNVKKAPLHAKQIFAKMDKDNDQMITKIEFVRTCVSDKDIYQLLTNEVKE